MTTAAQMHAAGRALAALLRPGDLVLLHGDLGAGKTTLAQGIGAGLDVTGTVSSPTFIIARTHRARHAGPDLVHVDAYRIGSLDDLETLDLDTSLEDSVTVVEWGEGLAEALSADRLELTLTRPRGAAPASPGAATAGASGDSDTGDEPRELTVAAYGARWDGVDVAGILRAALHE